MKEYVIDLSKAKLIIREESTGNPATPQPQMQQQQPVTPPTQKTSAQYQTQSAPSYNKQQGDDTPMTAEQIEKSLPKFLAGDVNAVSIRKAFGWAKRIIANPTLTNPQKVGFLTQIDVRFGTDYLRSFEEQNKSEDYIPFPC